MKLSAPLVEVRVPTFNRSGLLRRALESLLAQTWSDWRAIVLDDGNGERTRAVLDDLGDRRPVHRPNPTRLGAGRNLPRTLFNGPHLRRTPFGRPLDHKFRSPRFPAGNPAII